MTASYQCLGCTCEVDPDTEPSPGEPNWCPDCTLRHEREQDIRDEWFADDVPGDAA